MRLLEKLSRRLNFSVAFASNVAALLVANAVNNATMFLANMLIARCCTPELFGSFSVAVNVTLMTLTISEFGMNQSMIRLYTEHRDDQQKGGSVLLAHLYFKFAVIALLVLISLTVSGTLARTLFHDPAKEGLVRIALVSGGVLGVWSFCRVWFQLQGRFRAIASLTIGYALLRLAILGALFFRPWVPSPEYLLVGVYVIPLVAVICFCLVQFSKKVPLRPSSLGELWQAGRESVSYSKWVALTGISFVLIQQSLVFIVATCGGIREAAMLNAGLVFTAVFSLISDAVTQVLYPKVAGYPVERLREFRRRLLKLFPVLLLGSAAIMGLLSLVMVLFLGAKYRASLPIFWITGFGTAITIYIGFYSLAMHTLKRPEIAAYVNGVTLVCFIVTGVLLMKFVSLLAVTLAYVILLVAGESVKALLIDRRIAAASPVPQELFS